MLRRRITVALAGISLCVWPAVSEAAGASAIFGEVSVVVVAMTALLFLVGVFAVVWGGVKTAMELYNNREEGKWFWYAMCTVGAAGLCFIILPRAIAPGVALGALPESQTRSAVEWNPPIELGE